MEAYEEREVRGKQKRIKYGGRSVKGKARHAGSKGRVTRRRKQVQEVQYCRKKSVGRTGEQGSSTGSSYAARKIQLAGSTEQWDPAASVASVASSPVWGVCTIQ